MTPATEDPIERGIEPEIEVDSDALCYPATADESEQRRAFVLDCIGQAASEMDSPALCQMVIDLAEMLRTGAVPSKKSKPKLQPVQ
jgi:hypothetical protein